MECKTVVLNEVEDQGGKKKGLRNILTIMSESYSWVHGRQMIVSPFQNTFIWKEVVVGNVSSLGSQFVFAAKGIKPAQWFQARF